MKKNPFLLSPREEISKVNKQAAQRSLRAIAGTRYLPHNIHARASYLYDRDVARKRLKDKMMDASIRMGPRTLSKEERQSLQNRAQINAKHAQSLHRTRCRRCVKRAAFLRGSRACCAAIGGRSHAIWRPFCARNAPIAQQNRCEIACKSTQNMRSLCAARTAIEVETTASTGAAGQRVCRFIPAEARRGLAPSGDQRACVWAQGPGGVCYPEWAKVLREGFHSK